MNFKRSGTRKWNLPPPSYAESSLPAALSRVNALLMYHWHHADQSNLKQDHSWKQDHTVINDQILIKVNKLSDSEESPTPEGVHQDGTEVSSVTMIERKGVQVGAPRVARTHSITRTAHALCSQSRRVLCLAPATPTYGFQLATTTHSTTPTHAPTPTKPVPCRPYTALHVFRPCSTAERAGSGAWTRRRATMTGSAQMAYRSCRQRASAGATASPTSPSCSRGRASSSSIARSVRAPAACRDAPPPLPPL